MDDAASRFWDKYILKTTTYNVPEARRRAPLGMPCVFCLLVLSHPGGPIISIGPVRWMALGNYLLIMQPLRDVLLRMFRL